MQDLLGWDWRWISAPPNPYGIFSVGSYDVAGLAYRDMEGGGDYGTRFSSAIRARVGSRNICYAEGQIGWAGSLGTNQEFDAVRRLFSSMPLCMPLDTVPTSSWPGEDSNLTG